MTRTTRILWCTVVCCLGLVAPALAESSPGYCSDGTPLFNSCDTVCYGPGANNLCRTPCNVCECWWGGCYTRQTTCGEEGLTTCYIGYGQGGSVRYNEFCEGNLVPMNVNPFPPYPRAADGEFSCWGNTPDVLCQTQPPIWGYVNVRKCYIAGNGTRTDYGCNDCQCTVP